MSAVVPDMAGFIASRQVLFDHFGVPVNFLIPIPAVFDPSVPISEYGEPLDPWATPLSGGDLAFTTVVITATIVTRPYGGRGQVRDQSAMGAIDRANEQEIGINIRPADYARVGLEGSLGTATHVSFWNERFEIREWRSDGVGSLQRYVVYLSSDSGP